MGGGTRELYYYPRGTELVHVVGADVNPGLMDQAGVQAAIGVIAKRQSPAELGFLPAASQDAVVCVRTLGGLSAVQLKAFLTQAVRVLKPGAPLVFIEPGELGLASLLLPRVLRFAAVAAWLLLLLLLGMVLWLVGRVPVPASKGGCAPPAVSFGRPLRRLPPHRMAHG